MHAQHTFLEPEPKRRKKPDKRDAEWSKIDVDLVYSVYPRKVGSGAAKTAIRKALTRLSVDHPDPVGWLVGRVEMYAVSAAGQRGTFTPHCATWMNQERYDDDADEWNRSGDGTFKKAATTVSYEDGVTRYE